ncbi:hypothetical protein TNCV_1514621 [Trichonephila clavipes]|nr:hypothetical protein TNCV_1514621 [Trichonephila clavipes]
MRTEPSASNGQDIKWAGTDKGILRTRNQKKELGGERREVYKESERVRRGLDLREPFWRPLHEECGLFIPAELKVPRRKKRVQLRRRSASSEEKKRRSNPIV